jgi:DNA-binding CsgD family transcriptional regulator
MLNDEAKGTHQYSQSDREFTSAYLGVLSIFYPWALKSLSEIHKDKKANVPYYEFSMVRRSIKCNFSNYDTIMDIDQLGNWHFEEVPCPLRGGDCKYEKGDCRICKPKFKSDLSERELEIMQHYYHNTPLEQIAEKTFLSVETVKTHKRNVFRRTNCHTLPEFIHYAKSKNLFQ